MLTGGSVGGVARMLLGYSVVGGRMRGREGLRLGVRGVKVVRTGSAER